MAVLRLVLLAFLAIVMFGAGSCGVVGLWSGLMTAGSSTPLQNSLIFLLPSLLGLLIAWGCFKGIRAVLRKNAEPTNSTDSAP